MTSKLYLGDCLDVMAEMEPNSVDTIITDPPYGLEFMGKDWDHGIPGVRFWQAALRVAKPGALLLAFGGTRTHHRLMCAIEDAGWEIRDVMMWLYGSGFPKNHDISKAIDKAAGAEREVVGEYSRPDGGSREYRAWEVDAGYEGGWNVQERNVTAPATSAAALWDGWGTALKPAWEPIVLAMKPREGTFANNALVHGVAGLNIDGTRIEHTPDDEGARGAINRNDTRGTYGRKWPDEDGKTPCSTRNPQGRWPANLILDEDAAEMLGEQSGETKSGGYPNDGGQRTYNGIYGSPNRRKDGDIGRNTGTAARFFYCAKASRAERNAGLEGMEERPSYMVENGSKTAGKNGVRRERKTMHQNNHPTVKPLDLMRYLCKLTKTPTGGTVLDPFMGSGTTGIACVEEGREFIGIEIDPDYYAIAERRIEAAQVQPCLL